MIDDWPDRPLLPPITNKERTPWVLLQLEERKKRVKKRQLKLIDECLSSPLAGPYAQKLRSWRVQVVYGSPLEQLALRELAKIHVYLIGVNNGT